MVNNVVSARSRHGNVHFVFSEDGLVGCGDPSLLGWFVDDGGDWTVALLVSGELLFVSGRPSRKPPAIPPPEST